MISTFYSSHHTSTGISHDLKAENRNPSAILDNCFTQIMMNKATSSPGFIGLNNLINGPLRNCRVTSGNEEWTAPSVSTEVQSKGGGKTSVFANSTLVIATAFGFVSGMSSKTANSGCLRATTRVSCMSKLQECKLPQIGPNNLFGLTRGAHDVTGAMEYPAKNKPKDFVGCEILFLAKDYDSDNGTDTSKITLYTNQMETMHKEFIKMMKAHMAGDGIAGHKHLKSAGLEFDLNNKLLFQSKSGSNLSSTPMSMEIGIGMTCCMSASAMRNVNLRSNPSMSRLEKMEEEHYEVPSRGNEEESMKKSFPITYISRKSAGLASDHNHQSRLPKIPSSLAKSTPACGVKMQSESFTIQFKKAQEEIHQENQCIGNGEIESKDPQMKTTGFWIKQILQPETNTPDNMLNKKKLHSMFLQPEMNIPDNMLNQKKPHSMLKRTVPNEETSHECSCASPNYSQLRENCNSDKNSNECFLSQEQTDCKDSMKYVSWMQCLFEAEANPKSLQSRRRRIDIDESKDKEFLAAKVSPDIKESKKDVSLMLRLLQDKKNSSSLVTRQMSNSDKNYDRSIVKGNDDNEHKKISLEDVDNSTMSKSKTTNSSLINSIIELKMEFDQKQSLIDELSSEINKRNKIVREKDDMIQNLESQNEKLRTENKLLRMQVAKLKNPSCNTLISIRKMKE